MSEPRVLGSGRVVCPKCGLSYTGRSAAIACCKGERRAAFTGAQSPVDTGIAAGPDHWLACAETLEALAKELRAGTRSPEDMGEDVVRLGRVMRRAT